MRAFLAVLLCAGLARAQDVQWVYFESSETGTGPVLELELPDGTKQKPAAFTYTYPEPISWEKEEFSIGRAPVCEQALWMLTGKQDAADLERALGNFMKWRTDLRAPVKLTPGWTMPRGVSSYFYFFAYYHAARAIEALGGPEAKKRLRTLRADLTEVAEADGTWVDYPAIGKPYGTAMALLVLHMGRS